MTQTAPSMLCSLSMNIQRGDGSHSWRCSVWCHLDFYNVSVKMFFPLFSICSTSYRSWIKIYSTFYRKSFTYILKQSSIKRSTEKSKKKYWTWTFTKSVWKCSFLYFQCVLTSYRSWIKIYRTFFRKRFIYILKQFYTLQIEEKSK